MLVNRKKLFVKYLNSFGLDFKGISDTKEFTEEELEKMYKDFFKFKSDFVTGPKKESKISKIESIFEKTVNESGISFKAIVFSGTTRQIQKFEYLNYKDHKLPFLLKDYQYRLKQQVNYIEEIYSNIKTIKEGFHNDDLYYQNSTMDYDNTTISIGDESSKTKEVETNKCKLEDCDNEIKGKKLKLDDNFNSALIVTDDNLAVTKKDNDFADLQLQSDIKKDFNLSSEQGCSENLESKTNLKTEQDVLLCDESNNGLLTLQLDNDLLNSEEKTEQKRIIDDWSRDFKNITIQKIESKSDGEIESKNVFYSSISDESVIFSNSDSRSMKYSKRFQDLKNSNFNTNIWDKYFIEQMNQIKQNLQLTNQNKVDLNTVVNFIKSNKEINDESVDLSIVYNYKQLERTKLESFKDNDQSDQNSKRSNEPDQETSNIELKSVQTSQTLEKDVSNLNDSVCSKKINSSFYSTKYLEDDNLVTQRNSNKRDSPAKFNNSNLPNKVDVNVNSVTTLMNSENNFIKSNFEISDTNQTSEVKNLQNTINKKKNSQNDIMGDENVEEPDKVVDIKVVENTDSTGNCLENRSIDTDDIEYYFDSNDTAYKFFDVIKAEKEQELMRIIEKEQEETPEMKHSIATYLKKSRFI